MAMFSFVRKFSRELIETNRELLVNKSGIGTNRLGSCLNFVGKLGLVPPSLSVRTPSFRPRRWHCELLLLLRCRKEPPTVGEADAAASSFLVLSLLFLRNAVAVNFAAATVAGNCRPLYGFRYRELLSHCSVHPVVYFLLLRVNVAESRNLGVLVTYLSLVRALLCSVSRICLDSDLLSRANEICHVLLVTVNARIAIVALNRWAC